MGIHPGAARLRLGRERAERIRSSGGQGQVVRVALLPEGLRLGVRERGEQLGRCVPQVRHQAHGFVIAQHDEDLATGLGRIGFQSHHQVEDRPDASAPVREVARLDQGVVPASPLLIAVGQLGSFEEGTKLVDGAMDVADGHNPTRLRRRRRDRG
jgi:hypothetical protein